MHTEKKVWVAYLAAIPWGLIGVHKFYLRQPTMGFVYFFTGGLFALGWLYDLFTLPAQVDSCNRNMAGDQGYTELLEEEIEDLEDEIIQLEDEILELRSRQTSRQESGSQ